ncbi:cysteine-tryptophan domain-containing zinc finger protein 3-like [Andrographis paniculata]|uniref:cysteine-tryptophan domain-containing zinc finger protein 3-like n=1 Tax=Andrographis paniculata TaxID=175694 RepID=UPI0021E6F7A2|nr:cysteine-tryptophan domain-containing zinc finger protein 3-like [Andrographis paniculata]
MISVGSRDGRKSLGSGFEMEDAELEEGEALSCHDEGEDSTIDPDIAFSYIEEKIENVLGHFQKDFEGGVSAEKLGAKYGGYGSFLPTHCRSPSWSHTKSPAEAHNHDSPRSPRRLQVEDQRRNSIAPSSAYLSVIPRAASGKDSLLERSIKHSRLQPKQDEGSNTKTGRSKGPANSSEQRTLKVRIKVGSENLSMQKNVELYSGLGLVVSPSSSLDDSPATSERHGAKNLHMSEESPTSILQIMTSHPQELLLSPLSEDLIHLTEKRKSSDNKHVENASIESSGVLGNGYLFSEGSQKILEQKKRKPNEKDGDFYAGLPIRKINGRKDYTFPHLKKENEADMDTLGCEEIVSKALKLPLLSGTQGAITDYAKDATTATNFPLNAVNDEVKEETWSTFMEEEHIDSKLVCSSGKVSESKKGNFSHPAAFPHTTAPLEEKCHDIEQSGSNISKGRKGPRASETSEQSKENLKGGSVNIDGVKRSSEKSSNGGKRKQKFGVSAQAAFMGKDESKGESSLTYNAEKNCHLNSLVPKNESNDLQKVHEKSGDRYKDFFGDIEFENDDNESISGEMTSFGGLKNQGLVAKKGSSKHNILKEKCTDENLEKPPRRPLDPDTHPRHNGHLDPLHENGTSSEHPTGTVPLVKEDWVSCDKCHKWRLLPVGTNPNSLPHKWICRMLNWLPGMNRCSIPEEETTNALMALYNPAAPFPARASENQDIWVNNPVGTSVGMTSVDASYPDYGHQTMTLSGKKRNETMKASDKTDLDGSTKPSNLRKKNLGASGRTRNLSSKSRSPSLDSRGYQHMPQSASTFEKYNDVKKEKTSHVNNAGQDRNRKMKNKQEPDLEVSRASKRIKSEDFHFDDDNWTSDNGGTSSKAGRGSSSLSNNISDNDRYKYNHREDLGIETKNVVSDMNAGKHVQNFSRDNLLHAGKCEESVRKRKMKEPNTSQFRPESISNLGRGWHECSDFVEEMHENDHRKEKKPRVSKSGGKETSGSKTNIGSDRKSKGIKDQYNGLYLGNNQAAADYLKNDVGSVQPSLAANSSSSKVSGSHKHKTGGLEVKGSPVESVSSSPLRFCNPDKVTSSMKHLDGKDDTHDFGSLSAASPKKPSAGEGGRNDREGLVKNQVTGAYSDKLCQTNQYGSVKQYSEQPEAEEKVNTHPSDSSGFQSKKSGKWASKDKVHTSGSVLDKVNVKALDDKLKSRRSKSDEKSGNPSKGEKFIPKKDTAGGTLGESSKGQSQNKFGHDGSDSIKGKNKEHGNDKLSRKNSHAEVSRSEKSHSLPPSAKAQTETVPGLQKENGLKTMAVEACDNGDAQKELNQRKRAENPNGKPIRHPTPNSHKARDVDAPSPLRRDSSSHAANHALKEAKDLKHLADRLKNSGSSESIGYYFQAALKFLHGASLLESGSSEANSKQIYSSTAKLCEFCAHEYEKLKDMAAAALAYKCMEVAYMRVVYSSHTTTNKDRKDIQQALQIVPSGESPSSSASDVDNLNHQTTDKAALAKAANSPQVPGSHIITSRYRSGFLRILTLAQDVNFAMEASRKSRIAYTAAISRMEETSQREAISSLKKALDFNFQDVESLLRLVRFAVEAIVR